MVELLRLWQFADSALPIGGASHSFGLETLVSEGVVTVENLAEFLESWLEESGAVEAAACRTAHGVAVLDLEAVPQVWRSLNDRVSALRPARESRDASLALGRRFLRLACGLLDSPHLQQVNTGHHSVVFGLVGGVLGTEPGLTAMAYLQQSVTALVSACQRLLPLGQTQAVSLVWHLKPCIVDLASRPQSLDDTACFNLALDVASMRHPHLETRLFIS